MKNIISINFTNSGVVDLVTRLDTGTNEVWLSILDANGGSIDLGTGSTVSITSDNFSYQINSALWVGDDALTVEVSKSSTTYSYTINKIDELTGDIYIQQDAANLFTLVRGSNDGGLVHKDVEFEDWEQMTPEEQADGTEYFVWNGGSAKVPLDYFYPIGSIYMSVNNISPALLFGGTWEKIEDKFLLGSGSDYTLGNEGGEATHTLTTSEMPNHMHELGIAKNGVQDTKYWFGYNATNATTDGSTYPNLGRWRSQSDHSNYYGVATPVGGGQAHNNMPPYLVVNIWVRVADPEETSEG